MDNTSKDEPIISSEEGDAAEILPDPPQQPEVIPISSDKENDDDENSSDTSTFIDTEAEGGKNIAEEEERHQNWFGGIGRGNGAFNALVPPVLLQRPAHLRMSAEDYELLFLG